ncbi:MAG: AAA family ATPase [Clostridia bacterium]|nr:AAA family ATPase [Clostridia bacterium]
MQKSVEFIMLVGLPGSGKSTFTAKYSEMGYKILSSDVVRAHFVKQIENGELKLPTNTNLNAFVFDNIKMQAISALNEGVSVVFDATNLGRKRRINFRKSLYKINCVKKCILFITPIEECLRRNNLREGYARLPYEAMYKMFCNFECPSYFEGWDEIIPITYDIPYEFDFNLIKGFSQDNPHHTLSLDGHINMAYEIAVKNNYSQEVQTALKYHDIGKFYTKKFENFRGEKTEIAHFYGHEGYSAYLFLTEHCSNKELTKEQFNKILYITNLINCHMRPLTVWKNSDNAKEKDKRLFGDKFFFDLIDLNNCDRLAH